MKQDLNEFKEKFEIQLQSAISEKDQMLNEQINKIEALEK